jgi:hypothetical protein
MFLKRLALASLIASSFVPAFAAEPFALPQVETIPPYSVEGRSIDIFGFKPGMSATDALALFKEKKPGEEISVETSNVGTRNVSSVEFPSRYSMWKRENEEINVFMDSPSVGNEVFAVSRSLEFWRDEKQPDFEATLKAFVDKYGKPSAINDVPPDPRYTNHQRHTTTYMWYIGGRGVCELKQLDSISRKYSDVCTEVSHKTGPDVNGAVYSPSRAETYAKTATAGTDLVLVATVYNLDGGPRAFGVTVSFIDLKRRDRSAVADIKAIQAEQAKFDSVKVAAPEL